MSPDQIKMIDMTNLYWVVGVLVVTNLGTVATVIGAAVRGVWWLAKMEARLSEAEKDVNAAHERIREVKKEVRAIYEQ